MSFPLDSVPNERTELSQQPPSDAHTSDKAQREGTASCEKIQDGDCASNQGATNAGGNNLGLKSYLVRRC